MENRTISPVQRLMIATTGRRRAQAEQIVALDNECAYIAQSAREPMMAQIRLAWWRDGLASEEALPAHRSPMMDALRAVEGFDLMRSGLIAMVDGWEELILWGGEEPQAMLEAHAAGRGGGLFAAFAPDHAEVARKWGQLWALWDLAGHLGDADLANAAIERGKALAHDLSGVGALPRMLVMLARAARYDLLQGRGMPPSLTPGLYMRLLRLQIFGR